MNDPTDKWVAGGRIKPIQIELGFVVFCDLKNSVVYLGHPLNVFHNYELSIHQIVTRRGCVDFGSLGFAYVPDCRPTGRIAESVIRVARDDNRCTV